MFSFISPLLSALSPSSAWVLLVLVVVDKPASGQSFFSSGEFWTGWEMWPTEIIWQLDHEAVDPVTLEPVVVSDFIRLNRPHGLQDYVSVWGDVLISVEWNGSSFDVSEDGLYVSDLPASFWQGGQVEDVLTATDDISTFIDHSVNWGRADVILPPLYAGFMTGILLDLIAAPTFILLRLFGVAGRAVNPASGG